MQRSASAVWRGAGKDGSGVLTTPSGALKEQPYSFKTRFASEDGRAGTNPEELLAAAHASCYSMALASGLVGGGWDPMEIKTSCTVGLEVGVGIVSSKLVTTVELDGEIADDKLREVLEREGRLAPADQRVEVVA